MTRELQWREVDVPALNQALSSGQTYYVQDSAMLEIKPLEVKDYESQYRAEYWRQLSLPQDGMWEVFARMAGYSELIWAGKPCGFVSVNKENQLLHFFVMPPISKSSRRGLATFPGRDIDQHSPGRES